MGELTVRELAAGEVGWLAGVLVYKNKSKTCVDRVGELTVGGS